MPRSIKPGYQVSSGGVVHLDSRNQAIQDQWPLQIVKGKDGKPSISLVGFVPNVDQTFGGLFKSSSPPPSEKQPPCVKHKFPWSGKIKVVKNGKITNQVIK
jgi:hypothetical protein